MKTQTAKITPSPILLWTLVVFCVLLALLVGILVRVKGTATASTSSLNTNKETDRALDKTHNKPTTVKKDFNASENNTSVQITPSQKTKSDGSNPANEETPRRSSNIFEDQDVPYLTACLGVATYCDVEGGKHILSALGKSEKGTEFFINGTLVKPKYILIQINKNTYGGNALVDASGKKLISSEINYREADGVLQIKVGMNAQYYQTLNPAQRHTLYLEQIVRTFILMLQEKENDFIRIQQVVSALSSWQPAPFQSK